MPIPREEIVAEMQRRGLKIPSKRIDVPKALGGGVTPEEMARVGGGAVYGALETASPTEIPRGLEFMARAATTPGSLSERLTTASQETVLPSISDIGAGTRTALRTPPWKLFGRQGLETFEEELKTQREGEEAAFDPTARTVGGIATALAGLAKGTRGGPIKAAARAEKSAEKTARQLLTVEDDVLSVIKKYPDKIAHLVKTAPKDEVSNIGLRIADELSARQTELAEPVQRFRHIVSQDMARKIDSGPLRDVLATTEETLKTAPQVIKKVRAQNIYEAVAPAAEEVVTRGGGSVLSSSDQAKFKDVASLLAPDKISPRDAMLIVDKIDALAPPDPAVIEKGLIGEKAYYTLRGLRKNLKDRLRGVSEDLDGWLDADKKYAEFQENGGDLIAKFSGDQRESLARNIFNQAKDPVRQRLVKALEIGGGRGADSFFNELNSIRAAQGIKTLQLERTRPDQERVHEIVRRWRQRGERAGGVAGASTGGVMGKGSGLGQAGFQGVFGYVYGRSLGGEVGQKIGMKLSDPMRVLAKAKEAKILSAQAKKLAEDVSVIGKLYGTEGMQAFFNVVGGASPAVAELQNYILSNTKEEGR